MLLKLSAFRMLTNCIFINVNDKIRLVNILVYWPHTLKSDSRCGLASLFPFNCYFSAGTQTNGVPASLWVTFSRKLP